MPEQDLPEDFSLEEKLEELRILLDQMQKGMTDFDQQMALFRHGQSLIAACRKHLDATELLVEQILQE